MGEVRTKSLAEQVVERIVDLIADNNLANGDRLPSEKELSELFGVGRSTIREAVSQLQNLQVLSVKQGKGTFVKEVSTATLLKSQSPLYRFVDLGRNELHHALDVKKLLQLEIIRLAAKNAAKEDLAELYDCYHRHRSAVESLSVYQFDLEMQSLFAQASGNSILPLALGFVNNFLEKYSSIIADTLDIPEYAGRILEQYRLILRAVESGDGERAAEAMLRHLNTSRTAILASFDIFAAQRRLG